VGTSVDVVCKDVGIDVGMIDGAFVEIVGANVDDEGTEVGFTVGIDVDGTEEGRKVEGIDVENVGMHVGTDEGIKVNAVGIPEGVALKIIVCLLDYFNV
jgi:hypothetical protein